MPDIHKLAPKLHRDASGFWRSGKKTAIAYPSEGNQLCEAVETGSFWFQHRNDVILNAFKIQPPHGWILDIGGGNGYVSKALANAGWEVVLLEPGEHGARKASAQGIKTIIVSTLQDSGIIKKSIPAAGLFDTLEHIQDDVQFLKRIHSLLEPGGLLYITVPAHPGMRSVEDDYVGHFNRYTQKMLANRLHEAHFKVEYSTYFFGFLPIPIFLLRTLPYRLHIIKKFNEKWFQQQLKPNSPFVDKMSRIMLRPELALLRRNKRLPFGASLLVVAKKVI